MKYVLILLMLLLAGCSSKILVKDCTKIGGPVYECEKI